MSASRSPSLGNIHGYDEDFDSFHDNTTALKLEVADQWQ